MEQLTIVTLAWELHEQGVRNVRIGELVGRHRETVGLWIKGIEEEGLERFRERYEGAKKGPRERRRVTMETKKKVWAIRERERECCGQKIAWHLEREDGVSLSVPKIYEILAEKYELRSKWKKNVTRGPVPEAKGAREVVQMDTVDFGGVFAFTGVDICSKEADVRLSGDLNSAEGRSFLEQAMGRRFGGRVGLIQTDGGSEFKAEFAEAVGGYCDRHRVARPYKKNEQAYIESFNRTLRKECLGWAKYRREDIGALTRVVEGFLTRYHYRRPHMGFDPMRPPLGT